MKRNTAIGIAAGVVLVVAVYFGATAWSGRTIETRYQQQVSQSVARYPFLKAGAQTYQRGFFSATSTTALQIGCSADPAKPPPQVIVTSTIHHGPFAGGSLAAAVVDSEVTVGGEMGQQIAKVFNGPPLTAHTVIGFDGHSSGTVRSPAAKVVEGDSEFVWNGLDATYESGGSSRTFAYHVKSPGLSVSDPHQNVTMKIGALDVQADGQFIGQTDLVRTGKSKGSIASFELAMAGGPIPKPFSAVLTDMKMSGETAVDGDLMSAKSSFNGAGVIGGAKIDRFDTEMSFKRLHAPTYQHMMESIAKLSTQCDAASREAAPAAMLQAMQADLNALLQHDPELSLDKLAVDYAGQRGEMSYSFGVQGVTKEDAQLPTVMLMMTKVEAKMQGRIPLGWLHQLAQLGGERALDPATLDVMIDKAVNDGYVVRDGDFVASKMEFAGGQMTVNGKVLSPPGGGAPAIAGPGRPGRR